MELHGGNIYRLKRESGSEVLDYSSNINPLGVPDSFKKAVMESFDELVRYPDIDYIDLRTEIANYNECSIDNVVVGNGATEVLFLYMKAIKGKRILIIAPTFAEYERAVKSAGKEAGFFPLNKNFNIDEEKLFEVVKDYDVVVMCNPNNPTGRFQNLEIIERIVNKLEFMQKQLFIDEAFIEFIDSWKNKTAFLLKRKNIFILRALTKFFALPGVRLGYGLTYNIEILEKIKEIREPWSVNGVADIAGRTMLKDVDYIERTESWIATEKVWFYNELMKINKIKVFQTEVNFILIEFLKDNSKNIQKLMINEGILVRDASNFMFLNDRFIRLAIKDRENNLKVIESLKRCLNR